MLFVDNGFLELTFQREDILADYLKNRFGWDIKMSQRYSKSDYLIFNDDVLVGVADLKILSYTYEDTVRKFRGFYITWDRIESLREIGKFLDCVSDILVMYAGYKELYTLTLTDEKYRELQKMRYRNKKGKEGVIIPFDVFKALDLESAGGKKLGNKNF